MYSPIKYYTRLINQFEAWEKYLKNGAKENPQMMLDLLVEKVFVHNDKIELLLKYTSEPKPTSPDDEDNKHPPEYRVVFIFRA